MTEEKIFLDADEMFVSNTRVVIKGTTYSTANITSVTKTVTFAKKGGPITILLLGGFSILASFSAFADEGFGVGISTLFIAFLILTAGLFWYRSRKDSYRVIFATAAGETEALRSINEETIDKIISAVNEAIVARG